MGGAVVVDGGGRILVFPGLPAEEHNSHRSGAGVLRPLVHRWGELVQGLALRGGTGGAAGNGLPVLRQRGPGPQGLGVPLLQNGVHPGEGGGQAVGGGGRLPMADEPVPP